MSKIRQALKYEHLLSEAAVQHEKELREAAKTAYDHERELRSVFDRHERELREKSEAAVEKARDIQFNEYERRLDALNHAHEQAVAEQARTVPRTEFEQFKKDLVDRTALASKELNLKLDNLAGLISGEAAVTIREGAKEELLTKISQNNRWMLGILIAVAGLAIALFANVLKVVN